MIPYRFVQVTLSEGAHHLAHFKGNSHEYDLTQEADVSDVDKYKL